MRSPPLLDRAVWDEMAAQIGSEALRAVLDLFLTEMRSFVCVLQQAEATPREPAARERARRAAHSLKSSAGQIGAAMLSAAARDVERMAEDGASLGSAVAALVSCAEQTEAALRTVSAERGPPDEDALRQS